MKTFFRVDNHQFYLNNEKGRLFSCKNKAYSSNEFDLARKASKLIGEKKSCTFRFNHRKWKVVRSNDNPLWKRILRYFIPFFLKPVVGGFERFEIKPCYPSLRRTRKRDLGVYETRKVEGLSSFTKIAALGNQKHEPLFNPTDEKLDDASQFVMILEGDDLKLVKRKGALNVEDQRKAAVKAWKKQFIETHGKRKFDQIRDFYKLDFSKGLTPELVYRANIGATNIEVADLQDFATRYLNGEPLTLREIAGKERIPHRASFKKRLSQVDGDVTKLHPGDFTSLCKALEFSNAEKEEAYTGKKIVLPIGSTYTIAHRRKYKPWIDQQELIQISEQLKSCTSNRAYQELLAHVVVKKHLLRVDESGPRIGALIPAPGPDGGFYAVSGCISNGANLCYILESPVKGSQLPTIFLFRSTALDPFAMNWSDTIVNDFNHFNSPGYLGIYTLDPYMKEFIKQRTIPVWVGNLIQAERSLDEDEKRKWLEEATVSLIKEKQKNLVTYEFGDILRKHDQLLNMIFYPFMAGDIKTFMRRYRRDVLATMIETHVYKKKKVDSKRIQKDAEKLKKIVEKIKEKKGEAFPTIAAQADDLLSDLTKFVLNEHVPEFEEETTDFIHEIQEASREGNLEEWENLLHQHAVEMNEDVESKRAADLVFTGQSLGGGCAQMAIARYLAKGDRIPLPDHLCKGYFFQEPGINKEDTEAFTRFGNENVELMKELKVKFEIFKRHEAGDVVTTAGEMGLGAVDSQEDEEEELSWLRYDAAVNHRSKRAQHIEVAEAFAIHGTRFQQASPRRAKIQIAGNRILRRKSLIKERDYTAYKFTPYQEGLYKKGSMGLLKGKDKRLYKKLYDQVWSLPKRLQFIFNEMTRKSLKFPFLLLRKAIKRGAESASHTLPKNYTDARGAFAMTLDKTVDSHLDSLV